jgi:hypothetical protein
MNIEKAKQVAREKICDGNVREAVLFVLDALTTPPSPAEETKVPKQVRLNLENVYAELDDHGGGFHVHLKTKPGSSTLGTFTADGFFREIARDNEGYIFDKGGDPDRTNPIMPPNEGGHGVVVSKKRT